MNDEKEQNLSNHEQINHLDQKSINSPNSHDSETLKKQSKSNSNEASSNGNENGKKTTNNLNDENSTKPNPRSPNADSQTKELSRDKQPFDDKPIKDSKNGIGSKESSNGNSNIKNTQIRFLSAATDPNVAASNTRLISKASSPRSPGNLTPKKGGHWTFYGCSHVSSEYRMLDKLGEGTFGEVHKAEQISTGYIVALKRIFLHNEKEGFPITALREIRILKSLDHPNIIPIIDMATQRGDRAQRKRGSVYMVTPYMEHDLAGLLGNPSVRLKLPHIKCYMKQMFEGMKYLHDQKFLHRDIKSANILIDNMGNLRIADFGLARHYEEPAPKPGSGAGKGKRSYTGMVVTRWYRAPELVLGESHYTTAIDMWGIGCVFGEMFKKSPILQGNSDSDQAHCIFKLVGSPTEESMPGYSKLPGGLVEYSYRRTLEERFQELDPTSMSLLSAMLRLDPQRRITAVDALSHPFFTADPKPCLPEELPKYNDSHELDARKSRKERNAKAEQDFYLHDTGNQHYQNNQRHSQPSHNNYYDSHSNNNYRNSHRPQPPYRSRMPISESNHAPINGSRNHHPSRSSRPMPPYRNQSLNYSDSSSPYPKGPYRRNSNSNSNPHSNSNSTSTSRTGTPQGVHHTASLPPRPRHNDEKN